MLTMWNATPQANRHTSPTSAKGLQRLSPLLKPPSQAFGPVASMRDWQGYP